jgi:hypothetical protein
MEMRGDEKERPDGGQEENGVVPHGRPSGDGWKEEGVVVEGGRERNKNGRVVIH